jgi:glucose/arabinose dehydrogenase
VQILYILSILIALATNACSDDTSQNPAANQNTEVTVDVVFEDLSFTRPVDLQDPRDGTQRLFVVEQAGRIIVFENEAAANLSKVFLDIRRRVNGAGNEEGLLGLAFHPNYAGNGFFYVYYTAIENSERYSRVSRFKTSGGDADAADPGSEQILLQIPQPYSNHNGGQLAFGPDGFLYIAVGDGGSAGDPDGNGQNRTTLLGAVLRIDIDSASPYAIPADNPFVGNGDGWREEIYAYGLRNPWRISFDPLSGRLWAGDVGQSRIEEIDIIEKGKNYGWNIMEGSECYSPSSGCDRTGLELPVWEYTHPTGFAVTGGYVYRGSKLPASVGGYIYADYETGKIWALQYDGINPAANSLLIDTDLNISSFGVDSNGELFICTFDGKIYELKSVGISE